jgi:ABC-2 type transport system ATP-binding protein
MPATDPANEPVVHVQHISKVFRDFWRRPKVRAVQDVSFTIQRGEVFGLLGPNGSGKSTTIKMLLGLLHPSHGQIRILNRAPGDVQTKARMGYLPEESYLYPYLTSEETLHFFGRLFDLSRAERERRITQLLDMIGMQHARRRTVGEFSKGMARRIGLAQALINDPDLIILDEPTSGLDPLGCRQVKNLIQTLARRGKTVLLSSHLLADVEDVCDRIAILYNGRIQAMGAIHELLEQRNRFRVTLPEELAPDQLQHVLAALREQLGEEPEIDHPRVDLEQFFLQIIEAARNETPTPSGTAPARTIADYLAQPGTEPTPPPAEPATINERLRHLTSTPPADS